jgi:ribosomal protein L44E
LKEHFSRNTQSASLWCQKHRRYTMHRVDDVRKGPCLECVAELERQHRISEALKRARESEAKQIDMFPGIL